MRKSRDAMLADIDGTLNVKCPIQALLKYVDKFQQNSITSNLMTVVQHLSSHNMLTDRRTYIMTYPVGTLLQRSFLKVPKTKYFVVQQK